MDRTVNLLLLRLKVTDLTAFLRVAEGEQIAELLKGARRTRNETVEAVAQALHVSPDTVKAWESGRNSPRGPNVTKLAQYIESAFGASSVPAE